MFSVNRIIPIVKVSDIGRAVSFYCDRLGFVKISLFQRAPNHPGYATLEKDGCRLHVSSFPGDGTIGCCMYFEVRRIEDVRNELLSRGWTEDDVQIMNQDWGNREIYLSDNDQNSIRFGEH